MKVEDIRKEAVAAAIERENTQIALFEEKLKLLDEEIRIKSRTGVQPLEPKNVYEQDPEYHKLLLDYAIVNLKDAKNAIQAEIDRIVEHQKMRDAE